MSPRCCFAINATIEAIAIISHVLCAVIRGAVNQWAFDAYTASVVVLLLPHYLLASAGLTQSAGFWLLNGLAHYRDGERDVYRRANALGRRSWPSLVRYFWSHGSSAIAATSLAPAEADDAPLFLHCYYSSRVWLLILGWVPTNVIAMCTFATTGSEPYLALLAVVTLQTLLLVFGCGT